MAFGAVILIDAAGWTEVSAGGFAAAACVMLGIVLCASGLGARRR